MKILNETIDKLLSEAHADLNVVNAIRNGKSISPFEVESKLLAYLISLGTLSFDDYIKIASDYSNRKEAMNQYIDLFDMAPRTFGQTWGEQHIRRLFPEFMKATKENLATLYPSFDGEFDLWTNGIRVEVKACRANSTNTKGSLSSRAYSHEEAKAASFKYHYQQLKPSCCDVFIWIGVCKDALIYWVLTSEDLLNTGKLGSQHRNENTGIAGAEVFEGQVFMTEEELMPFLVEEKDIYERVIQKGLK